MVFSTYFNRFRPYFTRRELDTVDPGFYDKIQRWESWYRADVPGFHAYKVYRGAGAYETCRRKSLGMAKKLAEDTADLLLNEKVLITIDDEPTDAYVHEVLKDANFIVKGNEYQERKAATGTAAYIPYLADTVTDDEGNVLSASVKINYASAPRIFPTAWRNGVIEECVFAFPATHKRRKYCLMQRHAKEPVEGGGFQYVITNTVIDAQGAEVPVGSWPLIPAFAGLAERIETGSEEPQFAIDKLAIMNNAADDESNPMGIPIFANAIDVLAKIDDEYDSYDNEFKLGRKRIFVAPEMLQDAGGNMIFDPHDSVFYQLPEDYFKDTKEAIHETDMTLRVDEHEKAINQDLNLLSLKAGFGTQYYRFERGSLATATQVISENSDLYRTVRKHEVPLAETLKTLCRAIIRLGIAAGNEGLKPDADIRVDFDDSIIEDKTAERAQDRQDVAMGVMSLTEYRAKWYGETEEEAAAKLPDQLEGSGVMV